jgi:katanin p60 ATPase-containing subunit A1
MLAKAICSLQNSTFFNCSAATLISKYRGDSEKIIRCLFQAAKVFSPSVIFIDEIDALVSSRSNDNEHEASRRLKTELFCQLDGLGSNRGTNQVSRATLWVLVFIVPMCRLYFLLLRTVPGI